MSRIHDSELGRRSKTLNEEMKPKLNRKINDTKRGEINKNKPTQK